MFEECLPAKPFIFSGLYMGNVIFEEYPMANFAFNFHSH